LECHEEEYREAVLDSLDPNNPFYVTMLENVVHLKAPKPEHNVKIQKQLGKRKMPGTWPQRYQNPDAVP
jgi:hypothetical protein